MAPWHFKSFADWRASHRWRFIGFATGECKHVDQNGDIIPGTSKPQIHALFERGDGKRKFQRTGADRHPEHAITMRAYVQAWQAGGPLPPLDSGSAPPPKPKAPMPVEHKPVVLRLVSEHKKGAA